MEKKSEKIGKVNLDLSYYPGSDGYSEGEAEDLILEAVKNEPQEKYNDVIAHMGTWNGLYHLSDIRGNIVDFIPIQKDHKVLEIGAGCGAVTQTLVKKASKVTVVELSLKRSMINAYRNKDQDNLEILVGNLEDIEPHLTEKYDYIFLIGVLEYAGSYITKYEEDPYLSMLELLMPHLDQGGEIAVAIENKFGLKYFAGSREDHTGGFFDGIEGYPGVDNVKTFSKNGLMELAKKAGLRTEFYYPYPDYKLPSVIFSDERLPHPGEFKGGIRNFDMDRFVSFDEAKVFDEAAREEIFPLVSNSFLVMMSIEDRIESFNVKHVLYSKHSDERAPKYQIRTDILKDGYHRKYLVKYPKTQAAVSHLLRMYDNSVKLSMALKDSAIKVNRARLMTDWDGGFEGIQFEFLEGKTLDVIIADLMASDRVDQALNIIRQFAGFVRAKHLQDLDLIFSNILITADGTWNITDYEWMSEDCDPEFVIYRAIRYFLDEHEVPVPKEKLYEAAGLDQADDARFDEKEMSLQTDIAGDHVSLDKMYSIFGKGYVTLEQTMKANEGFMRPAKVKLYADMGEGFKEGEMPSYDGSITDDMRVSLDVPVPEGTKTLRFDPQDDYCILRLLDATVSEGLTNGRVCGNTVVFDNKDPQLVFKLPAGLKSFHIEYKIQRIAEEVYEDILQRLTELECEPRGILRSPRKKKEYVRISAVHGSD